jgi:hypothetical protein
MRVNPEVGQLPNLPLHFLLLSLCPLRLGSSRVVPLPGVFRAASNGGGLFGVHSLLPLSKDTIPHGSGQSEAEGDGEKNRYLAWADAALPNLSRLGAALPMEPHLAKSVVGFVKGSITLWTGMQ